MKKEGGGTAMEIIIIIAYVPAFTLNLLPG